MEEWLDSSIDCSKFNIVINQQFIEEGDLVPFTPGQVKGRNRINKSKIGTECKRAPSYAENQEGREEEV